MVREPDATMQLALQNIQLMSKRRVLSFKPCLRLEWRGQDSQNETEQPDHSASLGDSMTSSTRIRFRVHTAIGVFCIAGWLPGHIPKSRNYTWAGGDGGGLDRAAKSSKHRLSQNFQRCLIL